MKIIKGHIFPSGVFMIPLQRLRILFEKGEQNIKTVFMVISLNLGRAYYQHIIKGCRLIVKYGRSIGEDFLLG